MFKVALAMGATASGVGWVALAAGELSRSDRLLNVPVIGPQIKSWSPAPWNNYGPHQALKAATKTLGDLKGTEVVAHLGKWQAAAL